MPARRPPRSPLPPKSGASAPASAPATPSPLGWLHTARFLTTAAQLDQLPALDVPEIAFVGRSNAGKSTCINTLTQQKQLAFASKTPGRTQHINLFALGKQGLTDAVLTAGYPLGVSNEYADGSDCITISTQKGALVVVETVPDGPILS